jgi:hypothetical protein
LDRTVIGRQQPHYHWDLAASNNRGLVHSEEILQARLYPRWGIGFVMHLGLAASSQADLRWSDLFQSSARSRGQLPLHFAQKATVASGCFEFGGALEAERQCTQRVLSWILRTIETVLTGKAYALFPFRDISEAVNPASIAFSAKSVAAASEPAVPRLSSIAMASNIRELTLSTRSALRFHLTSEHSRTRLGNRSSNQSGSIPLATRTSGIFWSLRSSASTATTNSTPSAVLDGANSADPPAASSNSRP